MNKDGIEILNLISVNTDLLTHTIDNIIIDIKNEKFKEYLCKILNDAEVLNKDAKMILKANKTEIDKLSLLEKAQNLISIKLSKGKETRSFATIFYLNCSEILPDLYFAKTDFALSNSEEKIMLEGLIKLIEDCIQESKKYFTVLD